MSTRRMQPTAATKTGLRTAALLAVAAFTLAACGGGTTTTTGGGGSGSVGGDDGYGGGYSTPSQTSSSTGGGTAAAGAAQLGTQETSLGTIVAGPDGRSVYLFEKDEGTKSACYDACATQWPPVLTEGAPTAGSGVKADLLGTAERTDGTTGVTYNGHPLYYFAGDKKPGDVNGQGLRGFGAPWYVLSPDGRVIDSD